MADGGNREFLDALQLRVRVLEVENARLNAEILSLLEKLEICIEKYGPKCFVRKSKQVDWRKMLRDSDNPTDPKELKKIYRAACKQFNMSSVPQNHGIYYVRPNNKELGLELAVADPTAGFQPGVFFNFAALLKDHPKIAFKIAAYTMVKDTAISVVARFDIYDVYPPTQGGLDRKSGLSYRFHWGGSACAINSSPLPRDVLAPIFVSRDWHEMFATAFYFMNSFSFESLGEFGIFCRNTPRARWQRVSDSAITWIGSIMETTNPKKSGPRWDRSRWGMHVLGQFHNLRSLVISLDETSNGRIRRKDEPEHMKQPLKRSTRNHDNYRMTRDLRKLRGMDNIYQLRGIEHIEVYDNFQLFPKRPVRDQTFVQDLKRQVCAPKSQANEAKVKIKNLMPLLRRNPGTPKYKPSRQVKQVLKYIFNSRPRYERPDVPQQMAGDESDSDGDDDDEDPGDISDPESDDVDYDQLDDDDHQNPHDDDDSDDSDDSDDDAPNQGAIASREASEASRAGNFANGGSENNDDEDEDTEMGGHELQSVIKPGEDSDDDDFEFIHSEKLPPIKVEDDDELGFLHSVKRPTQTIDLSQLPDMADPDTALPSIEQDEVKQEVKSEDSSAGEGRDSMESTPFFDSPTWTQRDVVSPFGRLTPRRGSSPQSSLFVRQSPSARSAFSSRLSGYFGSPGSERKRSFEDEDDGDAAPLSVRRRLSDMTVTENEIEK